jgi:hypothetical protein
LLNLFFHFFYLFKEVSVSLVLAEGADPSSTGQISGGIRIRWCTVTFTWRSDGLGAAGREKEIIL